MSHESGETLIGQKRHPSSPNNGLVSDNTCSLPNRHLARAAERPGFPSVTLPRDALVQTMERTDFLFFFFLPHGLRNKRSE